MDEAKLVLKESYDKSLVMTKASRYLEQINNEPNEKFVKYQKYTKTNYVPIEIVEYLLTRLYLDWRVEVKEIKHVLNAMVCTVRLHVLYPHTMSWGYQDGVGAATIQVDKDASASDLSSIKSAAICMAAPVAKAYAVKNAAKQLGKVFGKDLNRDNGLDYLLETQETTTMFDGFSE